MNRTLFPPFFSGAGLKSRKHLGRSETELVGLKAREKENETVGKNLPVKEYTFGLAASLQIKLPRDKEREERERECSLLPKTRE